MRLAMPGPTCAVSPSIVCLPVKTMSTACSSAIWRIAGRQRVGGGQRVGAGEGAVGDQHGVVGAEADALAQRFLGLRRAHAQHGDLAAELVLQPQRLFEREQVVGVDDGRHALAHDGVGDRVDADLRRIRHLLDADDDVHGGPRILPGNVAAIAVPSG